MLTIIEGTRPEIIKLSPIVRELSRKNIDFRVIHTGQHYDYNMDKIFFQELELPEPDFYLDVRSGSHGYQTGRLLIEIEKMLINKINPSIVIVQGDTNTTLAGALSAAKLHVPVAHVEAGLRSFDKKMPEEINRILTDHLSDFLFAPTSTAVNNLLNEGIKERIIFETGNTIVDAIYQHIKIAKEKYNEEEIPATEYILLTLHRQENVDSKNVLKNILRGIELVYNETDLDIIFPIHPRTKKRINEFNLKIPKGVQVIEPVGYLEFLYMEANARLIMTDSGGVQEESCVLRVPCVTIRRNTERPETIEVGSNILAGTDPEKILESALLMLKRKSDWENPYGDGTSSKKIIKILEARLD